MFLQFYFTYLISACSSAFINIQNDFFEENYISGHICVFCNLLNKQAENGAKKRKIIFLQTRRRISFLKPSLCLPNQIVKIFVP